MLPGDKSYFSIYITHQLKLQFWNVCRWSQIKKTFLRSTTRLKVEKNVQDIFVSMMSSNSLFNAPVGSQDVDSK